MDIKKRLLRNRDAAVARAGRPEALAASFDVPPTEGLDWLGHAPSAKAPRLYRALVGVARWLLLRVCRLRVEVSGTEHLPAGGYIAVCALHRSWIDPALVIHALPLEPRVWFLGSGATAFDRPWKERLLRRTGGILPVWRGGTDIDVHARAAEAVVDAGAVLALFAEGRIGGPPDALARMRAGSALLCLRTGAPIVPIAIAGADELYRGKRMAVRILAPASAADLLGDGWPGQPRAGSREELQLAGKLTAAISERLEPGVSELYQGTLDPASRPRRWSWLTRLLR